jgi:hypothetical protein
MILLDMGGPFLWSNLPHPPQPLAEPMGSCL